MPDENTPADVTVNDVPTPTLPVRLLSPVTLIPALNTPKSVTDNDLPTPTLPVTTKDPPTPTLPVKVKLEKVGEEVVVISWMVLTAPDETVKLVELKEATPLTEVEASIPAMVKVPPKETGEPETDSPVPEVADTLIKKSSTLVF